MSKTLHIEAPHFVAGVEIGVQAAPIIRYMENWTEGQIMDYCWKKGWKVIDLGDWEEEIWDDWSFMQP